MAWVLSSWQLRCSSTCRGRRKWPGLGGGGIEGPRQEKGCQGVLKESVRLCLHAWSCWPRSSFVITSLILSSLLFRGIWVDSPTRGVLWAPHWFLRIGFALVESLCVICIYLCLYVFMPVGLLLSLLFVFVLPCDFGVSASAVSVVWVWVCSWPCIFIWLCVLASVGLFVFLCSCACLCLSLPFCRGCLCVQVWVTGSPLWLLEEAWGWTAQRSPAVLGQVCGHFSPPNFLMEGEDKGREEVSKGREV